MPGLAAQLSADPAQQKRKPPQLNKTGDGGIDDAQAHQHKQQPVAPESIRQRTDLQLQIGKDLLHGTDPPFQARRLTPSASGSETPIIAARVGAMSISSNSPGSLPGRTPLPHSMKEARISGKFSL